MLLFAFVGHPFASYVFGVPLLVYNCPEMLPVPYIYAKLVNVLSQLRSKQSFITWTRNFITVLSLPETEFLTWPPVTPFAPVPILNLTIRDAEMYSPWSSAKASVFKPAFGPDNICKVPGTKLVLISRVSITYVFIEVSEPMLTALILYSKISFAMIWPPFKSVIDTVALRSGW